MFTWVCINAPKLAKPRTLRSEPCIDITPTTLAHPSASKTDWKHQRLANKSSTTICNLLLGLSLRLRESANFLIN